jgi:O-antigen ligase
MTQHGKDRQDPHSRIGKAIVSMLCAIPLVTTLAYGGVDALALGVLFALLSIILVLWLIDSGRSGEFRFSPDILQLPIAGLILIAGLQLLPFAANGEASKLLSVPVARALSADPYATRFFLILLIVYFIFFTAALVYIPGGERPKRIAIATIAFGALLAFFGILQRLSMPEAIYGLRATPQAIPFGPFVNQHHFAALMQMTSGVALGFLFGSGIGRERKIFVALAAGIMGMAIIFTGSRGGMIGYLSVVVFAAVASLVRSDRKRREDPDASQRRSRNLLVITAAGGLVVIVLGSVLFLGGQESLLRGIGLQQTQSDPTSGRMHFWSVAWQIFLENPIIGAGMNSFGVAFTRFDTWNGFYRVEQAHNDYLQTLADGGILGFACVAAFAALFLKKGISAVGDQKHKLNRSVVTGALAGCIGVMVHSFFDFPLRTPANAFVFLLLVVLVAGNGLVQSKRRSV